MIGVVVFSRLSSRRLPGKALMDMGGRPLVGRIFDRMRQVDRADKVILATSNETSDDALAAFVGKEPGVDVFRGDLNDVSARTLACMQAFDLDHLVRICGDSPFEVPAMVDELIDLHLQSGADITTNVYDRTFPSGLSVEVVSREAYERAYPMMRKAEDFEHVTYFLYQHAHLFEIESVLSDHVGDLTALNLCVDTAADFERASWIAKQLGERCALAGVDELISVAEQWYALHPEDTAKAT